MTIGFAGPLLAAVIGSRRPLDAVWIALAAAGIVLLVDPETQEAEASASVLGSKGSVARSAGSGSSPPTALVPV